jgi:hypothetical protein
MLRRLKVRIRVEMEADHAAGTTSSPVTREASPSRSQKFRLRPIIYAGAGQAVTLVLLVSGLMVGIGLVAARGPARRGLRIQPSDALRADR